MEMNQIYNENCIETLGRLPDGCIDFMIQDTPFGCTQNAWDVKPNLAEMWKHWLRVGKPTTPYIFFATQPFVSELIMSNPKMFKYDIIWYKPLGTGHLNAKNMPMRNHEHILVFYQKPPVYNPQMGVGVRKSGTRKAERNGTNYGKFAKGGTELFDDKGLRFPQSIIEFTNGDRTKESFHPTQKPLDLIRYLVLTYTNVGQLGFDGYSGSGTFAEACAIEGRSFICAEMDTTEGYYQHSIERLKNIQPQLSF